jgi:hypothetical protein
MMGRRFRGIIGLAAAVVTVLSGSVQAATVRGPLMGSTDLCMTSPYVFYINGVWGNNVEEQAASALVIQSRMDARKLPHASNVSVIFNQTEGKALDVFRKLLYQKTQESIASQVDFAENAILYAEGETNTLPDASQQTVGGAIAAGSALIIQTFLSDPLAEQTLDLATSAVVNMAKQGYKVVVMAHSEGNMFAQAVYARTQLSVPNQYNETYFNLSHTVQVVNVATPAARPDTGKYVTSAKDIVINVLARILSAATSQWQPAQANADSTLSTYRYDPSGHGVVNVYLNDSLPANNGIAGESMADEVMRLVKLASDQSVALYSDAPGGALTLEAGAGSGSATYNVTLDGSTAPIKSTHVDPTMPSAPIVLSLSCSDLQEGTYHVTAQVNTEAISTVPPQYTLNLTAYAIVFGTRAPLSGSGVSSYSYYGAAPDNETIGVADIEVKKKPDSVGGYTLNFYPFQQVH